MDIKVLGPGCAKCQQTEKIVKEAVAETGVTATVDKVTDLMKIAGYGVFVCSRGGVSSSSLLPIFTSPRPARGRTRSTREASHLPSGGRSRR